jgi:hypothetical protein
MKRGSAGSIGHGHAGPPSEQGQRSPPSLSANTSICTAVSPKDGICVYLIMPTSNTACFQAFLKVLSRKFARQDILLVLDGAPNHRCGYLALPDNIGCSSCRPIRQSSTPRKISGMKSARKSSRTTPSKSIDAVRAKLQQAILYIARNPKMVQSITSFPYIATSL